MKNKDVLERYYAFFDQNDVPLPIKVNGLKIMYAVSKNKDTIQAAAKHLKADVICPAGEKYLEYENAVRELYKKHSEGRTIQVKTELGTKQQYDVSKNIDKFNKEAVELAKKYHKEIEERQKQLTEYQDFLEKDHAELEWMTFTLEELEKYNPDPNELTFNALKEMICQQEN